MEEDSYIVTPAEKAAFNNLQTGAGRDRFVEQFWDQRKPSKEEYYGRIADANAHFSGDMPGWKTDLGRIYITYGAPDEIESHPTGTPPFDHSRYYHLDGLGQNVDFNFVDQKGGGNYSIASHPPVIQTSGFRMSSSSVLPQRIHVPANIQAKNLITKADPIYPPLAEQGRIQGTVRFTVVIDKDGHVVDIQLVSGHPLLAQAAKDALAQYVYKPAQLRDQPVTVVTEVDVIFTLP